MAVNATDPIALSGKMKELTSDENFVNSLLALTKASEVQAALSEKGVELSLGEIEMMRDAIVQQQSTGEELTEEELGEVAGGTAGLLTFILKKSAQGGKGVSNAASVVGEMVKDILW